MHIDLSNKIILVTGASRGIGTALTEALASAGATVAVHYHRSAEAAQTLADRIGHDARIFQADLSEATAASGLFSEVISAYGRVDVLVNNAGIALSAPLDLPENEWVSIWQRTMAVNLEATGILCRAALHHFEKQAGGRIINVASRAAFRGDTADYLGYAASKGGVVALTRSIARAYGKQNIIAFTLAPGWVRTDMAQDFINLYGEEPILSGLALNELTEPQHIAPFVVLLASGLADHATGCTIDINAGSYVH